jgi:hypothetical protein
MSVSLSRFSESLTCSVLPLAFVFTLAGSAGSANPIFYTMTTTGTGTFGATAFTNAAITVTSVADTDDVFVASMNGPDANFQVNAFSSTISIAGFATATFTDQTFWVDPNGAGDIIFGDVDATGGFFGGILGLTKLFVGLETYDLKSSFGPVFSPFDFETSAFNNFQNIKTSGGAISLVAMNDTFTAVESTPEPASFLIAGLGLLGLLAVRLQPKRKKASPLSRLA